MKFKSFVKSFSQKAGLDFYEGYEFTQMFFNTVKENLLKKEVIKISGMGEFKPAILNQEIKKERGKVKTTQGFIYPVFKGITVKEKDSTYEKKEKIKVPAGINIKMYKRTSNFPWKLVFIFLLIGGIFIGGYEGYKALKKYLKKFIHQEVDNYLYEKGLTYNAIEQFLETRTSSIVEEKIAPVIKTQLESIKKEQEKSLEKLKKIEKKLKEKIEKKIKPIARKRKKKVKVEIIVYTVKKNDTLWSISKRFMNNPYGWFGVYKTNGEKIKDPDKIYPGQKILIPVIRER